ncbi:hypothetical protein, partial [Xanthomonas perforans]|uniref:hypothetical protein n=1 Tax=Xanthomonas perforans TaxID=442694 RepID=UPI001F326A0A
RVPDGTARVIRQKYAGATAIPAQPQGEPGQLRHFRSYAPMVAVALAKRIAQTAARQSRLSPENAALQRNRSHIRDL